jgi:hypothetical protein
VLKSKAFVIDELAIYYARHGVLVKQNIANLIRFPIKRATKVAFDFLVDFSRWRTRKTFSEGDAKIIDNYALLDVIRELYPRPEWAAKALSNPYKEIKKRGGSYVTPRQIILPDNFLLENG